MSAEIGDRSMAVDDATHEEGYSGPVRLVVGDHELQVEAVMRGYFEPIDGHYHWYGRLAPHDELTELVSSSASVAVHTPQGSAEGKVGEVDLWGRFRIGGVGRPPFHCATSLSDLAPSPQE